MIRRRIGDEFALIEQHEHALLAGRLAEHYGNGRFAPPDPAEPVIQATAIHDGGWSLHDCLPSLNDDGFPSDVFEMPLPLALRLWSAAADSEAQDGCDYTQLLVSLHVLGLSGYAASNPHTRQELFELNRFQQREIERQEDLRRRLGLPTDVPLRLGLAVRNDIPAEEQLRRNHNILQSMDRTSLAICCTQLPFTRMENVVPRPGAAPVTLTFHRTSDTSLRIDPWPFSQRELRLSVDYRAVPARPFASRDDFAQTYAAGRKDSLPFNIHA